MCLPAARAVIASRRKWISSNSFLVLCLIDFCKESEICMDYVEMAGAKRQPKTVTAMEQQKQRAPDRL